jgi:hypothetical protein
VKEEQELLLERAKASPEFLTEIRELAKKSLYFLSKAILGFEDLTPHLHQEVCNFVQDLSIPHELILLPRKHFKSTIVTISFPIWIHIQDWIPQLEMKGADVRILIGNESATNSEHFLSIGETLWDSNELLNILFPYLVPDRAVRKRWNQKEMLLNRGKVWPEASIETIGVGGAAQSRHYEIHILDDLIGKEAMESEVVMEKAISWYDYSEALSVSPRKYISRVPGTRWGKRDLYQHIIEKHKEKFGSGKGIYLKECREEGKPIFPEWYTNEYFEDLLAKNPYFYFSQYCNNPSDPAKCDFKLEWLKFYEWERVKDKLYLKLEGEDKLIPYSELDIVGAFDPSIDEKPTASRRAIDYVAQDSKERVIVLESYASRDPLEKVLDVIFSTHAKWQPRIFGVEKAALQKVFIWVINRECEIRKKYIACTPVSVSTNRSKEARIRDTLQPIASEGRLYVRRSMLELIQEWVDFPGGRTKDLLDALAMGVVLLRAPLSDEEREAEEEWEEKVADSRSSVTGY